MREKRKTRVKTLPPETETNQFCRICGEMMVGRNFGGFSCQSCRSFFQRTINKKLEYTCKKDKNCKITQKSRKKCQFCRFQKCLNMGMKQTDDSTKKIPCVPNGFCSICGGYIMCKSFGDYCEKCRKFFKRTVRKKMKYTCEKDGKCPIVVDSIPREGCKYCRYKRCLEKCDDAGMKFKKVAAKTQDNPQKVERSEIGNNAEIHLLDENCESSSADTQDIDSHEESMDFKESIEIKQECMQQSFPESITLEQQSCDSNDLSYYTDQSQSDSQESTESEELLSETYSEFLPLQQDISEELTKKFSPLPKLPAPPPLMPALESTKSYIQSLPCNAKVCPICGNWASVQWCGAHTCRECYIFFKHTIGNKLLYSCEKNKNCPIDWKQCPKCHYCYYQKCLASGMTSSTFRNKKAEGLCMVCGDIAFGKTNGVLSCNKCKQFVIRIKNVKNCKGNQKCIIHKFNRTQCQFCRYKKFLAVGMIEPNPTISTPAILSKLCEICGKTGNRKNYGVFSCKACVKFFSYSVRNGLNFICNMNGNCIIDTTQQNKCQYCHFQKCLFKGMKTVSVRGTYKLNIADCDASSSVQSNGFVPIKFQYAVNGNDPSNITLKRL